VKPGKRGPNWEEKPGVCHKTPPQHPVSQQLKGSIQAIVAPPRVPQLCVKWFVVRKDPFFDIWDWIAQCGCVCCQGQMVKIGAFGGIYQFVNRITLCLPECTKYEKRTIMYFGDLKIKSPEGFTATCSKNGWSVSIKIGGVDFTWVP